MAPINEYDDMVIGRKPASGGNEYFDMLESDKGDKKAALQQSMFVAQKTLPDRAAQVQELAKKVKLPTNLVERHFDELQKKSPELQPDYDKIIDEAPGLSKWLANPDNAAIGRDDTEALGKLERGISIVTAKPTTPFSDRAGAFAGELGNSAAMGWNNLNASVGHLAAAYGMVSIDDAVNFTADANRKSNERREKIPAYLRDFNANLEKEGGDVTKAWERVTTSWGELKREHNAKALEEFGRGGLKTIAETLDYIKEFPKNPKATTNMVMENLANSLPSLALGFGSAQVGAVSGGALGLLGGPVGSAAGATYGGIAGFMGGSFLGGSATEVGAQINETLQKRGYDTANPDDLRRAYSDHNLMAEVRAESERKGLTTAAVDTLFTAVAGRYLKAAHGQGLISKAGALGKELVVQSAGESLSEGAGQVAQHKGDLSKVDLPSVIQEGIVSMGHSVGEAVIGSSFRATLPKDPVDAVEQISTDSDRALKAQHDAMTMGEIAEAVNGSKLSKRMPDKIQELIEVATDGEANSVFFQSSDWDSYWGSKGVSPAKAAEQIMGDGGKAYLESKSTGTQLEIPLAKYISKVAPTEHFNGLLDSARTTADGMTLGEANTFLKGLPATMEALATEATKPAEAAPVSTESAASVKANVTEQLKGTGLNSATAGSYAQIYESAFKSLGERAGVDPLELFNRYGLQIGDGTKTQSTEINSPEQHVFEQVQRVEGTNVVLADFGKKQTEAPVNPVDPQAESKPFGAEALERFTARFNSKKVDKAVTKAQDPKLGPYANSKVIPGMGWAPNYASEPTGVIGPDRISEAHSKTGQEVDSLQWSDMKYQATQLLISKHKNQGIPLVINTSSDLVGHDDYIALMPEDTTVRMHMLTKNEELNRVLFPGNPSRKRLETSAQKLKDQGIKVEIINPTAEQVIEAAGGIEAISERLNESKEEATLRIQKAVGPRLAAVDGETTLKQASSGDDPRGRIMFGNNRQFRIDLLKNADLSTFLHETGHFYLEVLGDLAQAENATPQIKDDYATILKWLGVTDRNQIETKHHEEWARGFESYLMEGKAPTSALREAFARFKVWLLAIYKDLRSLNVSLNQEVKDVMGRLLATDQEITEAQASQNMQPLFDNPETFGMTGKKAEAYKRAREEARASAVNTLESKVMADFNRAKKSWYKEQRDKIVETVSAEVNQSNVYKAISILQKGLLPDGSALPVGTPVIKIDKKALTKSFGKEIVQKLPKGISTKDGLHPDIAAEMLGFESGDQLVTSLANAPKRLDLINKLADQQMSGLYPDILVDGRIESEAIKAVHNEKRSQLLRLELEHLASNDLATLKNVIKKVARRMPPEKTVRKQAQNIIGNQAVKNIKPNLYQRAEIKAANEAGSALAKGDLDAAFEAKQRELLNHELYRAAVEAQETLDDSLVQFKKISKADEKLTKSRDIDMVNAARAILAQYGIGKSDKPASSYLEAMKMYDPQAYETMATLVASASERAGPYKEITFDTFIDMKNTVDSIWELSRTSHQLEIDGIKYDRAEVKDLLEARLGEITKPGNRAGYDRAATSWDKTKMGLLGMKASLRRTESWVDAVDGDDQNKSFRKFIWNPISESISNYREAKRDVVQKYLDIVKGIEKTLTHTEINAPELGYRFGGKAELLGALLHTGNESNFSKLLRGRNWGDVTADGAVDARRWNKFLERMWKEGVLTKADYDYAQSVWDLLESMKPNAQRAHKKMYGYYFNEITADEIVTPFGTYKGGYVPAIADPFISEDSAIRQEKEQVEKSNNSFMFPTSGRGFTRKRVDQYAAPLSLDLRFVPGHIDKVLRFSIIEPHVKEVSRIVMDKGFRQVLSAFDPTVGGDMLVPWLQRSAQQKVVGQSQGWGGKAADKFFSELRKRTGLQVMTANVVNTLQQVTGFSIGLIKVGPKHIRNGMWSYVRGPKAMADSVNEKSAFMRTRTGTQVMEIQQTIDELLLNPNKYEQARAYAQKHGYFMQAGAQNVVDLVVWSGGYDQAVEEGATELEAVRQADTAVRATQGSFNAEDISRFETGTPFMRAFTMFYSYFNMQANLLGTEFTKTVRDLGLRKGAGRLLYIYATAFMIPAVVSEMIVMAMSGRGFDEGDDDEYLSELMSVFFGSQFRTATAMVPGVGPAVNAGINMFNDKWYDDRISTSPAISMIESSVRAPKSIYDAMTDDKNPKRAVKDTLSAMGLLTGLPLAPLAKPIGYLADVMEGDAEPRGPADFTLGLVTGKSGTKQ